MSASFKACSNGSAAILRAFLLAILGMFALPAAFGAAKVMHPGHYVYMDADAEFMRCADYTKNCDVSLQSYQYGDQEIADYLDAWTSGGVRVFRGIQRGYTWKDLEPTKGNYDFSKIDAELKQLAHITPIDQFGGQKMIIQFTYLSWDSNGHQQEFPDYIYNDHSTYGTPYLYSPCVSPCVPNYYPVIWNVNVQNRLRQMLQALAAHINPDSGLRLDDDPIVEAINTNETDGGGAVSPLNLIDAETYGDAIKQSLIVDLKAAFPNTPVIVYANFPQNQLQKWADAALAYGVGWGGPDVTNQTLAVGCTDPCGGLVGSSTNPGAYAFYSNYSLWNNWTATQGHRILDNVVKGAAVQNMDYKRNGNWDPNFDTIFTNATTALRLNYLFWQAQWPQGTTHNTDIINFVRPKVNASPPSGSLITTVPTTKTLTFTSEGAYDGLVTEGTTGYGGWTWNADAPDALRAGDTSANKQYKSILSFNTMALPDNAIITGATLKMKAGVIQSPWGFGTISVDVKTWNFSNDVSLQPIDFEAAADAFNALLSFNAGLSYPLVVGDWSTGYFNSAGVNAIKGTVPNTTPDRIQMRLYMSLHDDGDSTDDYYGFYSGEHLENGIPAYQPVLGVTYHLP